MNRRILQLGAGNQRLNEEPGRVVRVDRVEDTKPDVVWDLDRFPWPLAESSFDVIDCTDVIEHLEDIVFVMEEIHRVGRPGALVRIATPHYSSSNSFTDPTHRHHLGIFSFDYFTGENKWNFYTEVRFRKKRAELIFHPGLLNRIVRRVARRWPQAYEQRLCWIFPAWFMSFELEVVK